MKFVTFAAAPTGQDYKAFQDWCSKDYAAAVATSAPTLRGAVLRRRIEIPGGAPFEDHNAPATEIAPCDVMMEFWFPAEDDFRREVIPAEKNLSRTGARFISYAVLPQLHKDPRFAEGGPSGARPEVTFIGALKWRADLDVETANRHWQEHAPLAMRAQPYLTKYEQNRVIDVISWSPDMPPIGGYVDCSFRTITELQKKFVPTMEEGQDASRFAAKFHATYFGDTEKFSR